MKILTSLIFCVLLTSCKEDKLDMAMKKEALKAASDKRVETIISLLKADCDSSLLRETYKRVQQQPKAK
jgi:hypothetical protein